MKAAHELTDMELALAVGDRVPGGLVVASTLIREGRRPLAERLHALGIKGSAVWIVWKDLGDQTIETLERNLESEDLKQRLAALGY